MSAYTTQTSRRENHSHQFKLYYTKGILHERRPPVTKVLYSQKGDYYSRLQSNQWNETNRRTDAAQFWNCPFYCLSSCRDALIELSIWRKLYLLTVQPYYMQLLTPSSPTWEWVSLYCRSNWSLAGPRELIWKFRTKQNQTKKKEKKRATLWPTQMCMYA